MSAWAAIANGITPKATQTREKYWQHWANYATRCGVDPFLQDTPPLTRDIVINAFAARVRTGTFGRGVTIRVQGVTDAILSISKTIQLAGLRCPIYREDGVSYNLSTQRLVEGFCRQDPPSVPQLAVPITVPNLCFNSAMKTKDAKLTAIGELTLIAFYFLLRVGEYTKPRYITRNGKKVKASCTVQFTVGNVGFFKDGSLMPRTSPLSLLQNCDAATLKITN